ncbi:hypothetical protein C8A00DRAFT_31422 [Chaetomidium leptoderma]|uniref:Uncharacterized protein n=1 Tax=Chaetomidium leptoderma TaxID=669021 RepID=A0AAN6VR24_9PEZI|nr:hypothetical protein C8A00DRAFT_31422 [Chaetomidium leptoderma]
MDKVKGAMKKGLEKVTGMHDERLQEDRKETLDTTWPTREQHPSMTGGPDQNTARASHSGNLTGMTGKDSMGQPANQPAP